MRSRTAQLSLTLVCIIFGALLMIQFRTQGKIAKAQLAESATDQATIITSLYEGNVELRREVEKLETQLQESDQLVDEDELSGMVADVNRQRLQTGLSEVKGPGVIVRVAGPIRTEYVQDLINELRNAGAEAIAVNDQRIVAQSAITSPTKDQNTSSVIINGATVESPYVFQAIGSTETLDRAIGRKGGMLSYLQNTYPDIEITLSKETSLTLPIYRGKTKLQFAQVVK